jgi:hypothetical protein
MREEPRRSAAQTSSARPRPGHRYSLPISKAHLFWLLFSIVVAGVYFSLRASMGDFITVLGLDITPVMLGEIGAALIAVSAAYTFRKRLFIGGLGNLDAWLWMHVYLSLLSIVFIWYHSRQRFSSNALLANAAMFALILTVLSGVLGRLCYVLIPRTLARLTDYDPPERLRRRIAALETEAASIVTLKSGAFRAGYERLLRQRPASGPNTVASSSVPPVEAYDYERMRVLLLKRGELRRVLRRRTTARRVLDGWWTVHVRLMEAGLLLAALHILSSLLIDHRWK